MGPPLWAGGAKWAGEDDTPEDVGHMEPASSSPHFLLHVEQEVAGDDTPALQSVLESDTVREDLCRGSGSSAHRLLLAGLRAQKLHSWQKYMPNWRRLRLTRHLPGHQSSCWAWLYPKMQQQPTREFSGGWRMRLALARALFARPDLC